MIYLRIRGRIGNQLFMYATAKTIQYLKGKDEEIVVDDTLNIESGKYIYDNSLKYYKLNNVSYIDENKLYKNKLIKQRIGLFLINNIIELKFGENNRWKIAKKMQWLYNAFGVFHIQDGYVTFPKKFTEDTLVDGYFQSEKFFEPIKEDIKSTFRLSDDDISDYPNIHDITNRNTVCISIKVQHNVGNYMYDICHEDYYEKAIQYICERVENPLFFICSDNVEYVKNNLIDTEKYDVVCQDSSQPVQLSLAAMARCKHFIIGNTSFGWWAQYLSDYQDKIVVVPNRWYNGMDVWQYDIYMDNWVRMDV